MHFPSKYLSLALSHFSIASKDVLKSLKNKQVLSICLLTLLEAFKTDILVVFFMVSGLIFKIFASIPCQRVVHGAFFLFQKFLLEKYFIFKHFFASFK
jgi:hypothetical protein